MSSLHSAPPVEGRAPFPAGLQRHLEGLELVGLRRELGALGSPVLRRRLVALDAIAIVVAWTVALLVPWTSPPASGGSPAKLLVELSTAMAATFVAISAQRLYLARVAVVRAVEVARLARAMAIAAFAAYLAGRALDLSIPVWRLVTAAVGGFLLLAAFRSLYDAWLKNARATGRFTRPIVIVGANDEGLELYHLLCTRPEIGLRAVGVVGRRDQAVHWGGVPWLGRTGATLQAISESGANGVVIAVSALSSDELNQLARELTSAGAHVHLSSGLRGIATRRLRPLPLAYEPAFYLEPVTLSRWQFVVKRAVDLAGSIVLLTLSSPILLVAAAAIKLEDRGPVLFRQTRVGRGGRQFDVLKLRTMVPDAEAKLAGLQGRNVRLGGPLFKLESDPRQTKVGRLIEKLSLDELPQLVNVLRGQMSLVGPRPALPSEVEQFDDALLVRLSVAPGITGLWQVEARDNPVFDEYRRLDLFYVENWSVTLDLAIILATFRALLVRFLRGGRTTSGADLKPSGDSPPSGEAPGHDESQVRA